jgi:Phospholipase_D-nuclease N-terminal
MDWFWWLAGVVAAVAWTVALVDIVRSRRTLARGQLAAWVLIVVMLPLLGTVLYFAVGRRPANRAR